jgi:hypothetical protein
MNTLPQRGIPQGEYVVLDGRRMTHAEFRVWKRTQGVTDKQVEQYLREQKGQG